MSNQCLNRIGIDASAVCVTGSRTQERSGRTVGGVTEQQPYEVLERFDGFELRRYPPHLVAEVELDRVGRHDGPGRPDRRGGGGYVVAFVLPASMTLETAPVPTRRSRRGSSGATRSSRT